MGGNSEDRGLSLLLAGYYPLKLPGKHFPKKKETFFFRLLVKVIQDVYAVYKYAEKSLI